jgi:hypothetical protein
MLALQGVPLQCGFLLVPTQKMQPGDIFFVLNFTVVYFSFLELAKL